MQIGNEFRASAKNFHARALQFSYLEPVPPFHFNCMMYQHSISMNGWQWNTKLEMSQPEYTLRSISWAAFVARTICLSQVCVCFQFRPRIFFYIGTPSMHAWPSRASYPKGHLKPYPLGGLMMGWSRNNGCRLRKLSCWFLIPWACREDAEHHQSVRPHRSTPALPPACSVVYWLSHRLYLSGTRTACACKLKRTDARWLFKPKWETFLRHVV